MITFNEKEFQVFKNSGASYMEYRGFKQWGKYLYTPKNKEVLIIEILSEELYQNCKNLFISEEETGFCDWLDIATATKSLKYLNEIRE